MTHREPAVSLILVCVLWLALTVPAMSQELPRSTVWLAGVGPSGLPSDPVRISQANGYNNQPHFSPDSRVVYFTAEGADAQTDIWAYDIQESRLRPVSRSPLGDFSPTPIPGERALSVVRVEGDSRQRLWRIDLDNGAESSLLPSSEPVGYHAWITGQQVAMFMLGTTFDLHFGYPERDAEEKIVEHIGRSLRLNQTTGELFFVATGSDPSMITAIDPVSRSSRPVITLFPGVEDFAIDHRGWTWCGLDSKLYFAGPEASSWTLAADLSEYGIHRISRLDASPDGRWMAIVSSP